MPRVFSDAAKGRDNSLNLIRMIAACSVLVSHSYPISLGPSAVQPLQSQIGMTLGQVSVLVFFAISGYLIAKSFDSRRDWRAFLIARAFRLLPALAFVLALTILVGGLFLTTAPPREFWPEAARYFFRNLGLAKLQYELPGIFVDNPYGPPINGSLWTLFYEVLCYAGVLALGLTGLLSNRIAALVIAFANLVLLFLIQFIVVLDRLDALITLAAPFSVGAAIYVWRDYVPFSAILALALWLVAGTMIDTGAFSVLFTLALAYSALLLGFSPNRKLLWYNRLGDFSYGTYVFAFPIQQIVASLGVTSPVWNILLAFPFVLMFAAISWHFVEAPALRRSRFLSQRLETRS